MLSLFSYTAVEPLLCPVELRPGWCCIEAAQVFFTGMVY
jgi:hypothetical protein